MGYPEIHVAIRSFKRAGAVSTLALFPKATVWVPESQEAAYRLHYGEQVRTVPDREDGNCPKKSNAILKRTPSAWTLIVDDDITKIGYWEDGAKVWMKAAQIKAVIAHHFDLAAQMGVTLWGFNQVDDALAYRTQTPYSLLAPILGPIAGHVSPVVRYDPTTLGKEDYDFWLQTIARHHRTLRANKYVYRHDSGRKPGGLVSVRTMEFERKGVQRMREKWGALYRSGGAEGPSGRGTNILNSIVTVPIAGV
jgi:hypothetical protein